MNVVFAQQKKLPVIFLTNVRRWNGCLGIRTLSPLTGFVRIDEPGESMMRRIKVYFNKQGAL
jgi:hypothetical protein